MDNIDASDSVCIYLDFSTSQSAGKREKIREFWKFLDEQNVLTAFEKESKERDFKDQIVVESSTLSDNSDSSSTHIAVKPGTPNVLRLNKKVKQKSRGSDHWILKKSNKKVKQKSREDDHCKLEKYFREDLVYADCVEVTYDEINAEINEFKKHLPAQCICQLHPKLPKCDCDKN